MKFYMSWLFEEIFVVVFLPFWGRGNQALAFIAKEFFLEENLDEGAQAYWFIKSQQQ